MNSRSALEVIEKTAKAMKGRMILGAGTVLDAKTARKAVEAGAQFILSPTVSKKTIKATKGLGVVSIPGAFTPTEIFKAYSCGADIIKVFPASAGPSYIKDVMGPLSHIPMLPTGGVNLDNIQEFKKLGVVGYGIGSSLVDTKKEITEEYLAELTEKARQYVEAIR
jgi:2-dehydro-3-deoxyphosphogluconate aldolase/(4S)-4-hydroxy-2-oxoglutarate aldolase